MARAARKSRRTHTERRKATQAAILSASIKLLIEDGYAGFSASRVAARAGVMTPTFDPVAAGGEYVKALPGLAEKFEIDNPGMHTTDTIDYGILIDGEIHLELDNNVVKKLSPRDIVVQNGTRHAWRNKSTKPATMLFVLVGATRSM